MRESWDDAKAPQQHLRNPVLGGRSKRASSTAQTRLTNRVLGYFQRRGFDGLAGWFGREFHRLLSERIDAVTSFRGWFIDHRHFDEPRNYKLTGFIQLLVANHRQ